MRNTVEHHIKYKDVGEKLLKLRTALKMSRIDVYMRTGIKDYNIGRHEKGEVIPTLENIRAYEKLYGVEL